MKKKFDFLFINKEATLIEAFNIMDDIQKKLLIVVENGFL